MKVQCEVSRGSHCYCELTNQNTHLGKSFLDKNDRVPPNARRLSYPLTAQLSKFSVNSVSLIFKHAIDTDVFIEGTPQMPYCSIDFVSIYRTKNQL